MDTGSIIFTKKIRTSPEASYREMTFKGHLFAVALGHHKKGDPLPTQRELEMLCAKGGLYFENAIEEFLGEKQMQEFWKFMEKKFKAGEKSKGKKK